jgi:hypothetical protein
VNDLQPRICTEAQPWNPERTVFAIHPDATCIDALQKIYECPWCGYQFKREDDE